ncbi:hypothetical protein VTJ83DRAFT_3653 [Remersonia thermophila]|uniref:Uncharacterized protein n=1 Tax=Remersonia thermophila TaxID=72144 RepID=A0ABR4DEP2_9PEZI
MGILCFHADGCAPPSLLLPAALLSAPCGSRRAPLNGSHAALFTAARSSKWSLTSLCVLGNTVYIGVGLSSPTTSTRWIKSLVSLLSFCLGAFFFSRFHRRFSPARRWVLIASFSIQLLLTAAAAAMVTGANLSFLHRSDLGSQDQDANNPFGVIDDRLSWDVLVPIALVAFQSCGQAVASRALKYPALTSVVLTSVYCDLFSDPALFVGLLPFRREEGGGNPDRNRRAAAPVSLLLGAFAGGWLVRGPLGMAAALWTAAGVKAVVVGAWVVWPGVVEAGEEGRLPA